MMSVIYKYGHYFGAMRFLLVLSAGLFLFPDSANAARGVSGNRECATCHIMWLEDFKRADKKPLIPFEPKPVVDTGKQDVASTERMCFSCHDGFVLDSRFLWKDKKHAHPVGVKPSKKIVIPTQEGKEIFPMNDDNKMYCGTCHSAHGVDWSDKTSPIFLRIQNVNSSLCLACHLPKGTGPKEGNHPVFKSLETPPSSLVDVGAKFSSKKEVICESCHRPHAGKDKKMLVMTNQDSKLCQTCHVDKRGIANSKHDMIKMDPETKNVQGRTAEAGGPCSSCHIPHEAKGSSLWARNLPKQSEDVAAEKCFSCHNKQGIASEKVPGKHSHPVNVSIEKLGIKATKKGWQTEHVLAKEENVPKPLPLFDIKGHRNVAKGKVSCATCHDPHNWSVKKPANTEKTDTTDLHKLEGDGNNSFLRIAQGHESKLCLNCHVAKRTILTTKHNLYDPEKMQEQVKHQKDKSKQEKNKNKEVGICAECHSTHYGKGSNLRIRGRGPGSMEIETWCRDCHRKDGEAKKKLVSDHGHPLGKKPDGDVSKSGLPLFNKQGQRDQSGLVDCATCHNAHQWNPQLSKTKQKQKEDVEGDGHTSFLRRAAAGESDLCAQCHKEKTLVFGTDHDLRVTAAGTMKEENGVCGQCHSIHKPTIAANLWGRKPGKAEDAKEQQCRSCHSKDGIAKEKNPTAARHPEEVTVWSGKIRQITTAHALPDVPVFNKEGERQKTGMITCASCHDPHRWSPRHDKPGTGKNVEGDAMNSFLRNKNSQHIVCGDCHGKDALFRYKYFHGKTSRKKHSLYN